jgi:hypothetical protein
LGGDCELFGEQEVQIGYVIARADGRIALSACCEGSIETQPEAISPSQLGIASPLAPLGLAMTEWLLWAPGYLIYALQKPY